MKKKLAPLIILSIFLVACAAKTTLHENGLTVVEGKVGYYGPRMAIGAEADPSGFILLECRWLSGAPTFSYSRVYVKGAIDSSYLNKRVRITGALEKLSAGGVETPLRNFPMIEIRQLESAQ